MKKLIKKSNFLRSTQIRSLTTIVLSIAGQLLGSSVNCHHQMFHQNKLIIIFYKIPAFNGPHHLCFA